jgi:hypothetical protein
MLPIYRLLITNPLSLVPITSGWPTTRNVSGVKDPYMSWSLFPQGRFWKFLENAAVFLGPSSTQQESYNNRLL